MKFSPNCPIPLEPLVILSNSKMRIKGGTEKMTKTYRLINVLLIFIPMVLLAFIVGLFGLILFEFHFWRILLSNE
jgi:hypothetical protein